MTFCGQSHQEEQTGCHPSCEGARSDYQHQLVFIPTHSHIKTVGLGKVLNTREKPAPKQGGNQAEQAEEWPRLSILRRCEDIKSGADSITMKNKGPRRAQESKIQLLREETYRTS
jgi:hypothetical protein